MRPLRARCATKVLRKGLRTFLRDQWPARHRGHFEDFLLHGKKLNFFYVFIFGWGRSCGAAREECAHSLPQQRAGRW